VICTWSILWRFQNLFKNRIRETEHQNILDRLFAEIMIDAEDLFLVCVFGEVGIQLVSRFQIVAKRFFDDDPLPAFLVLFMVKQSAVCRFSTTSANWLGRRRKIKKQIVTKLFIF